MLSLPTLSFTNTVVTESVLWLLLFLQSYLTVMNIECESQVQTLVTHTASHSSHRLKAQENRRWHGIRGVTGSSHGHRGSSRGFGAARPLPASLFHTPSSSRSLPSRLPSRHIPLGCLTRTQSPIQAVHNAAVSTPGRHAPESPLSSRPQRPEEESVEETFLLEEECIGGTDWQRLLPSQGLSRRVALLVLAGGAAGAEASAWLPFSASSPFPFSLDAVSAAAAEAAEGTGGAVGIDPSGAGPQGIADGAPRGWPESPRGGGRGRGRGRGPGLCLCRKGCSSSPSREGARAGTPGWQRGELPVTPLTSYSDTPRSYSDTPEVLQ